MSVQYWEENNRDDCVCELEVSEPRDGETTCIFAHSEPIAEERVSPPFTRAHVTRDDYMALVATKQIDLLQRIALALEEISATLAGR